MAVKARREAWVTVSPDLKRGLSPYRAMRKQLSRVRAVCPPRHEVRQVPRREPARQRPLGAARELSPALVRWGPGWPRGQQRRALQQRARQ